MDKTQNTRKRDLWRDIYDRAYGTPHDDDYNESFHLENLERSHGTASAHIVY